MRFIFLVVILFFSSTVFAQRVYLDTSQASQKYPIKDYSAIGMLLIDGSSCTAFLISQESIMTAAHCIDFKTKSETIDGIFMTAGHMARVVAQTSMHRSTPIELGLPDTYLDFAVLDLDRAIPEAHPMKIASKYPKRTDPLLLVGYGCVYFYRENGKSAGLGARTKRISHGRGSSLKISRFSVDDIFVCPNDSGAPLINASTGEVVGVASTLITAKRNDDWVFETSMFANVVIFGQLMQGGAK